MAGTGPSTWAFVFEFVSSHAGYGDRTGRALPEAATRHRPVITVDEGQVRLALMDGRWDMLKQTAFDVYGSSERACETD